MLLITETIEDVEYITEEKDGKKKLGIKGIFMQSEKVNRNGRLYEGKTLAEAVRKYDENFVSKSRAMGELGHPEGPTVNLERVSHLIKDLKQEGNNYIGHADILETPYGNIVKNLIESGAKLGVSSRGMGSLERKNGVNVVGNDFMLSAVDIVADPSAPDAFVEGIMEGREWIWNNGILKERTIESIQKCIKGACSCELAETKIQAFETFLNELKTPKL
jgi:hypothetical protein